MCECNPKSRGSFFSHRRSIFREQFTVNSHSLLFLWEKGFPSIACSLSWFYWNFCMFVFATGYPGDSGSLTHRRTSDVEYEAEERSRSVLERGAREIIAGNKIAASKRRLRDNSRANGRRVLCTGARMRYRSSRVFENRDAYQVPENC